MSVIMATKSHLLKKYHDTALTIKKEYGQIEATVPSLLICGQFNKSSFVKQLLQIIPNLIHKMFVMYSSKVVTLSEQTMANMANVCL